MIDMNCRCPNCMQQVDQAASNCPHCGHDLNHVQNEPDYLLPGTVLNGRYHLGNLLHSNSESASYVAYDSELDVTVKIQEFMPKEIVSRTSQGDLVVDEEHIPLFRKLAASFAKLHDSLSKLRTLSSIVQVYTIFSENGTCYAVLEWVHAITLRVYLSDHYGELPWEKVTTMFIDVLKTFSRLHKLGIVHKGLSPETLLVTKENKIKVSGFSISPLRQKTGVITPEIYHGYAAPEQYETSIECGAWTDVYSLAAILYKTLTGTMPTESSTRAYNDNLIPPDILNANVPKSVSVAIMSALTLSPRIRTQTMDDLFADLVTPPRSTAQYSVEYAIKQKHLQEKEHTYDASDEDESADKKSKKYILAAMGITLSVLLFASAILIFFLFSENIFG